MLVHLAEQRLNLTHLLGTIQRSAYASPLPLIEQWKGFAPSVLGSSEPPGPTLPYVQHLRKRRKQYFEVEARLP